MGAGASGVHNTFPNAFMVKMENLFPQEEIFKKYRPPVTRFERVLVVSDDDTLRGCQLLALCGAVLVNFAAVTTRCRGSFVIVHNQALLVTCRIPVAMRGAYPGGFKGWEPDRI